MRWQTVPKLRVGIVRTSARNRAADDAAEIVIIVIVSIRNRPGVLPEREGDNRPIDRERPRQVGHHPIESRIFSRKGELEGYRHRAADHQ